MLRLCLLVVVLSLVHCFDYCQFGAEHTMCKYQDNKCQAAHRGVNQNGIDDVVKTHNELRQKVAKQQQSGQPGASNMKKLRWSSELATIAQRWADQCTFGHDQNRRSEKYSYVGQNAYMSWSSQESSTPNLKGAVQSWYNEVTKPGFNPNDINPFKFTSGAGHYTQVVWATTEELGCGFTGYKDTNGMYAQLIICNYGPGGNMVGAEMYKKGSACSQCSNGCSSDYPGLCE